MSASRRRIENLIICAVLSFEILTPLSYYLGARGYDERFSWRMFSTLRLRDCKVRVVETPRAGLEHEVAIEQDVQLAWLRLLERMRWAVVDRYLRRRCDAGPIERVEYLSMCHDTDGKTLPPIRRTLHCSESAPREESP
jgi:hypothetical protein